jgi:hypothetical protein
MEYGNYIIIMCCMQRILFSNTGCHYSETRANLPKKNGFSRNRFKMIQTKKWRLDRKYFTCDFKWLIVHEMHGRQRHSMPDQALGFKVAPPLASFIQNPCANCGAKTCTSSEILWNLVKLNGCYSHHLSSLSQVQRILWNEDFSGNRHGAEAKKAMWHSWMNWMPCIGRTCG